jgi:hypothetical protein
MSQPFKLFRLQQLDTHLDQAQARLTQIDVALSDDRELQLARSQVQKADDLVESARKALHRAEEDVRAQRVKIEQTEATLYGGKVRNPKELQDLQNEAAALKRYLAVLEDRQLEHMISSEDAEKSRSLASDKLDGVQNRNEQANSELAREQTSLTDEVGHLQAERQAEISSIPAEDLALYQNLRQQRRGVAVARVTDKTCAACGSTLSTALLHASRSPNQLTRCDTCGRILYAG